MEQPKLPQPTQQKPVQIFFNEQDITELVNRAREATRIIENLRIVGPTVAGNPRDGYQIN